LEGRASHSTPWSIYAGLLATSLFWGANFIIGKYALIGLPPFTVAGGRVLLAVVGTLVWLWLNPGQRTPLRRQDLAVMAALGASGVFGFNALYFMGLQYAPAGEGSLLVAITPVITAILAAILLGEAITVGRVAGVGLSFVGVAIIVEAGAGSGGPAGNRELGIALLLSASLCWGVYSALMRIALRRHSPLAATAYAMVFGALFALPAAGWEVATSGGMAMLRQAPTISWLAVVYAGLAGTVLGFLFWNRGIARLGATRASVFVNVVPVWAVLLGALVLGEQVTIGQAVGGIVVVASVMLANAGSARRKEVSETRMAK